MDKQKGNPLTDTNTYRRYLPAGIDKEPETVLEALIAARAVIVEEGRWVQGEWFINQDPDLDAEDPFCNGWGVCAEGAVGLVVIGVKPLVYDPERPREEGEQTFTFDNNAPLCHVSSRDTAEFKLYRATNDALLRAANLIIAERDPEGMRCFFKAGGFYESYESIEEYYESYLEGVPDFNDTYISTRTEAVAWFDKAIALVTPTEDTSA